MVTRQGRAVLALFSKRLSASSRTECHRPLTYAKHCSHFDFEAVTAAVAEVNQGLWRSALHAEGPAGSSAPQRRLPGFWPEKPRKQ